MKPTARRRLGKYVLLGRIGHGGMGKIYLAHAPGPAGIEKLLVVKRLHSHLTGDPVLVSSFLDEARLSMALNHPNIGHTFDVGEVDGRYFMVMEYIDGQNLGVVLRTAKRTGPYPKSTLWGGIFLSVLDGLHAAHTARDARGRPLQIIHRDVSPQNVLLTYEGLPKLVDFGIAKAAMRVQETDAGTLKGKYAYMSPEQVRGEPLDARSDVFAAGIVLWEMLAGRRLYKAETIVRSVERVLQEPPISPVRVNAECAPELAKVCLKALAKDKNLRFESADAFKDALEDAITATGDRFKPVQGRELMQRLFKDVIEKQRAVLEACLNQQGEIKDDDDDDGRSRGSDSQSDLNMPRLAITPSGFADGSTTPSSSRRSPLVTAEGDDPAAIVREPKATAVERKGTLSNGTPAFIPPPAPGSAGHPPPGSTPATAASVLAPPLEASTHAVTQTSTRLPIAPRRSLAIPVAAALTGVVVAVGVVWALDRPAPAPGQRVVDEDAVAVDAGTAVAARSVAVVVVDAGMVAEVVVDAGSIVASLDELGEPDEAAPPAGEPRSRPRRRRDPPRRVEPVEKPAEKPAEKADVDGVGFLTLDTVPWTTVFLGKRRLGDTPLIGVQVPAGTLELMLVNPEKNLREAYHAKVKPGETFKARLDLN
ncbi:MAG: serine/threonine-protein kinase [Deltaproteobacteria bacterium]|nr:serine/threonine-protein kinase [Deltaproteobacteria bacterium]